MTDEISKKDVAEQFGRMASAYAASEGHARGADLDIVLALSRPRPDFAVLDVATGAGHTACALASHVQSVVAVDLAAAMIERTLELAGRRRLQNVTARVMDAENLDFADFSFDLVTCRIAAHHFLDIEAALAEMARVLKPGGALVLEDSMAPDSPALDYFINALEKARDRTHVRSYSLCRWLQLVEGAGLAVVHKEVFRKRHIIQDWLDHAGADDDSRRAVEAMFLSAGKQAADCFQIEFDRHRPLAYTDDKLILRAEKMGG